MARVRAKLSTGLPALDHVFRGIMPGDNIVVRDAMLALVSLGYKQNEARAMVMSVMERGDADNVEDTVRKALAKAQRRE